MKPTPGPRPLHPQVGIGHVHLKVADLDRALAFYRDVLGFEFIWTPNPHYPRPSGGRVRKG